MAFPLRSSLLHNLHRVSQLATDRFANALSDDDQTFRQIVVLAAISARDGASQTDLVDDTGVDRSTLADIVRRLVKRGLASRRRSRTDARANVVRLTEEGGRVLAKALPVIEAVEADLLAVLPARRREALGEALVTVLDAHSKPVPGAQ